MSKKKEPAHVIRHLYQNSEVIYCAESIEQAHELFAEDMGETAKELNDPFEQIPDDKVIEVGSEEPSGEPGEVERKGYFFNENTAGEWAAGFRHGHFSGGDY